jgi:hypothetical protein
MEGWVSVGVDTYIKPVDNRRICVVTPRADLTAYDCTMHEVGSKPRLIGRGGTPRAAAQLIHGWVEKYRMPEGDPRSDRGRRRRIR